MSLKLTLDLAKKLIDEAIAERGEDFVYRIPGAYNDCMYVHAEVRNPETDAFESVEPEAGCGVGLAMFKAGVSLEALAEHEHTDAQELIGGLKYDGVLDADSEEAASSFLYDFQVKQDKGVTWGEARDFALSRLS